MSHPSDADLLVVVGLTGVGKSTVLDEVLRVRPSLSLLPNRRELTDRIIIPAVQERQGAPLSPVTDRIERFRATAAYREMHPGGMAHALLGWLHGRAEDLWQRRVPLVFDNLRGVDEVAAATDTFPQARFLVLDAAPATRLARLVERRDPFDRAAASDPAAGTTPSVSADNVSTEAFFARLRAIPNADDVFDPASVAAWAAREGLDPTDLEWAARIIVEEQRNYDSTAARQHLTARLPSDRVLAVDTDDLSQAEVVERVLAWLGSSR